MNRLDTMIAADTPLITGAKTLSYERLESWSPDKFALAVELARAPASLRSGLGDELLHLMVTDETLEDAVATLPLEIDGNALTLGLGNEALDALVGLLSEEASMGDGANLSLDALESLCVAILSPLMRIEVGRAAWVPADSGSRGHDIAALKLNHAHLSLTGEPAAVLALQSGMQATSHHFPPSLAPLLDHSLSGQSLPRRLAIDVETVVALVCLTQAERNALEPGCGLMLDTVWPAGRQVAGQRFVKSSIESNLGWHLDADLQGSPLRIRSDHRLEMLENLPSDTAMDGLSPNPLELVEGENVIARGQLSAIDIAGKPQMIFLVDQLV